MLFEFTIQSNNAWILAMGTPKFSKGSVHSIWSGCPHFSEWFPANPRIQP
jgi:hypothetical protein